MKKWWDNRIVLKTIYLLVRIEWKIRGIYPIIYPDGSWICVKKLAKLMTEEYITHGVPPELFLQEFNRLFIKEWDDYKRSSSEKVVG